MQKKVLRLFENYFGEPKDLPTNPLFVKYNLLKATKLYDYKLLLHIQKHDLIDMAHATSRRYPLRNTQTPIPRTRTNYGRSALTYQIPALINRVSSQINFDIPFHRFKKQIRLFLLNDCAAVTP